MYVQASFFYCTSPILSTITAMPKYITSLMVIILPVYGFIGIIIPKFSKGSLKKWEHVIMPGDLYREER